MPRCRPIALLAALAAGCAQAPGGAPAGGGSPPGHASLASLPATFESIQDCCVKVTLNLRPDGAYAVRQVIGPSEFYDFGRWHLSSADGLLFLEGGREAARYLVASPDVLDAQDGTQGGDLKRKPQLEELRGPFRLNGLYDGVSFRECRTGLSWPLDDSRAGGDLRRQYLQSRPGRNGKPALVAIDARFVRDAGGEEVRIQRLPAILDATACP